MVDLTSDRPVWAILAPLDPPTLRASAEAIQRERYRPADGYQPPWELVAGSGEMTALVSYELGSEGTDAGIAERLSAETPGQVVVLRFAEDNEAAWGYEGGRLAVEHEDPPAAVAAEYGIELPGVGREEPPPHLQHPSLCLVPGHQPADVARILGFDTPPSGPLHVEPVRDGSAVYSDAGSAAIFLRKLSRGTGGPVYLLASHDGGAAFTCLLVDNGEDVGLYEYPAPAPGGAAGSGECPRLDGVAGETEPVRILEALGVPPSLLRLREGG